MSVEGVVADGAVTVIHVKWFGDHAIELTHKLEHTGAVGNRLLYRSDEEKLRIIDDRAQILTTPGAVPIYSPLRHRVTITLHITSDCAI